MAMTHEVWTTWRRVMVLASFLLLQVLSTRFLDFTLIWLAFGRRMKCSAAGAASHSRRPSLVRIIINPAVVARMSVVHERQSRQLCAIHAVNNLLQLHSSPDADTADEGYSASMYQCGPFIVQRSCQVATKVEMDRIADDLALTERNLLLEDRLDNTKDGDYNNAAGGGEPPVDVVEGSSSDSTRDSQHEESELSLMDKLASNHRTIYLGCYSFECLELCLKRRGVTLEWYRVSDDPGKDDSAAALQKIVGADKVVCGFIINLPDESPTFWSTFRHVPVLGRLVHVGRHWFAVTRLRRRVNDLSEEEASASIDAEDGWLLIDSDREDVVTLGDIELNEYLASIHARGGQTFRAAIKK